MTLRLHRVATAVRVVLVVAGTLVLGLTLTGAITRREAEATVFLARHTGLDMTRDLKGTSLIHSFHGNQPFFVAVTPSCSALTAIVAVAGASIFVLGGTWAQRIGGALAAACILAVGNVLRLLAVLWVGHLAGVPAMEVFHNWGGTAMSYVLLVIGLLLMIAVRMPRRAEVGVHEVP